jgi:hypothetical protein
MQERRKHKRFSMRLPAMIEVLLPRASQVFAVRCHNVSSGGGLFSANEHLVLGTKVLIYITLPSNRLKELTGSESLLKLRGKVVRSNAAGLAISFDQDYQHLRLMET